MASRKIVANGEHAVDVDQVALVAKTGSTDLNRWHLEVFLDGAGSSFAMAFLSEADRDDFFKSIVELMEK